MKHQDEGLNLLIRPEQPEIRSGWSVRTVDARRSLIHLRGWILSAARPERVEFAKADGTVLFSSDLTERRPDVSARLALPGVESVGFNLVQPTDLLPGETLTARFLDFEGQVIHVSEVQLTEGVVRASVTDRGLLENRLSLSEAVLVGLEGDFLLRGWASPHLGVAQIRFMIEGDLVGFCTLNAHRTDLSDRTSAGDSEHPGNNAFVFQGHRSGIMPDMPVVAVFHDRNGRLLGEASRPLSYEFRLHDFRAIYDTESRQLRVKGALFSDRQIRALAVQFQSGRSHAITRLFLPRPQDMCFDPRGRTLYSGFEDRIPHVGEGDSRNLHLELFYADGGQRRWRVPITALAFDEPEAAIDEITIDWVTSSLSVKGWYRSFEPVTDVEIHLGEERVFGIPLCTANEQVQKQFGFRGPMAQGFTVSGPLDTAVDHPEALFAPAVPARLALRRKRQILLDNPALPVAVKARIGAMTGLVFDRRKNLFHAEGYLAMPRIPARAQLLINDRPVDEPLPFSLSMHEGIGHFSFTRIINHAMPPGSRVKLRFVDDRGQVLGDLAAGDTPLLSVSRQGGVDGLSSEQLAAHLVKRYLNVPRARVPTICFVFQGSVASATGGGITRLLDLMQSAHSAGYRTVLIDRSEPWSLGTWPDAYRALRACCDVHLPILQGLKPLIIKELAELLKAEPDRLPKGFAPLGKPMADHLANALRRDASERSGSPLLEARIDPQFLTIAATITNLLRAEVVITNYLWSAPLHDLLLPTTFGLLDTHDIQSLRARVFHEAHEQLGADAVPDPAKYDVDEEEELRLLSKAQALMTISPAEQDFLAERVAPSRLVLVGLTARAGDQLPPAPDDSAEILFVGNIYEPNVDGISLFLDRAWPEVIAAIPQARIRIAGRVCDALQRFSHLPGVALLGPVEDLESCYRQAALVLNPVRFGTGASVKLVEAMAFGRAVVTTPAGLRGYEEAADAEAVRLADPEAFGEAVIALLRDPPARHALERAAHRFATERLHPDRVHAGLFNFLESRLFY